jgi:hypothetical protein
VAGGLKALALPALGGMNPGPTRLLGRANPRQTGGAHFPPLPGPLAIGLNRRRNNGLGGAIRLAALNFVQLVLQFLNPFDDLGCVS